MSGVETKLKNIIQYALITLVSKDEGDTQIAQCEAMGKPLNYNLVLPYGLSSNAPAGSTVLRFLMGASPQGPAGIPFNPENRFKNLKPWEVALGNFLKKSKIFFDEDGNCEIDVSQFDKDVTIKVGSGTCKVNGNAEIDGDLTVTGDVISNGEVSANSALVATKVTLSGHSHLDSTGNPTQPPTIPQPAP